MKRSIPHSSLNHRGLGPMHRIYPQRLPSPPGHLHGYVQHKLADRRDDDDASPRARRIDGPMTGLQRLDGRIDRSKGSPGPAKAKAPGLGGGSFLNVYQKSPATSPQRSLERKNPEKRLARTQNIHNKLAILKNKRPQASAETLSPGRQAAASRRPSASPGSAGSRRSASKRAWDSQSRLGRSELSTIRSLYATTPRPDASPRPNAARLDTQAPTSKSPRSRHGLNTPAGRQTPTQARRIPTGLHADRSDGSGSQHSDDRNSAERSVRSNGLSLTRDNSIERRLYSSMKSRKDASSIAFRLNLNTLFSLDTILWKINTTHHVRDHYYSTMLTRD